MEKARIVKDGNVITAGGVTSGIDFGLSVVADISGEAVAQAVQLGIEYDPNPRFESGHPDRASDAVKAAVAPRYEQARADFRETLSRQGCNGGGSDTLLAPRPRRRGDRVNRRGF